jgi:hypothetical protein
MRLAVANESPPGRQPAIRVKRMGRRQFELWAALSEAERCEGTALFEGVKLPEPGDTVELREAVNGVETGREVVTRAEWSGGRVHLRVMRFLVPWGAGGVPDAH